MSASAIPGSELPVAGEIAPPLPKVRVHVARQSLALVVIATVAVVFVLDWAESFFISLLLGVLFSYTLTPVVAALERIRIPRLPGTCIVMLGLVFTLALAAYSLRGQVRTILDQLPVAASTLSAGLTSLRQGQDSTMSKMQTAANEFERATRQVAGTAAPNRQAPTRVVLDTPGFKLGDYLWAGSMGAAGLIGQAAMVLFLTFFLLLSGNSYKKKLVRLTGPSFANKKITIHILDAINESIQRYMFMLLATNLLVGLLTWFALRWLGLDNAGAWAVAAGLLHLIPYLGPGVTAAGLGMAAYMQFGDLATALLALAASLAIATLVGTFVTTWMTGRIAKMNTAAVFVSLLFWTWLWGIWGMLLSMPIMAMVKVVAMHVETLEPVAELLGD